MVGKRDHKKSTKSAQIWLVVSIHLKNIRQIGRGENKKSLKPPARNVGKYTILYILWDRKYHPNRGFERPVMCLVYLKDHLIFPPPQNERMSPETGPF